MSEFCQPEGSACDSQSPNSEYELPIETRLVKYLRRWSESPDAIAVSGQTNEQEIASLLEWFICDCLAYDPSGLLKDWWSDGVIQLRIDQQSPERYKLAGVTWIGSEGLAPFDIEVHLDPESDRYFAKCVFRLGLVDRFGRPTVCKLGRAVEVKERENREWAMAVELTPPEEPEQTDQCEPE